ncbi:MAG: response regulator [Oligoflexia bacterium]|nr:response regulator [Oligoflexia bacterium]
MDTITLSNKADEYNIGAYMELYKDKTGTLGIAEVSSESFSGNFKKYKQDVPTLGFTESVFWVRFKVVNASLQQWEWMLRLSNPSMDLIELYTMEAEAGKYSVIHAGDRFKFSKKVVSHTDFIFPLILIDPVGESVFYMKLKTDNAMIIPLYLSNAKLFAIKERKQQLAFGIYYGILLVMLLYNFFIFLTLKDKSYLYYVVYTATVCLFQMSINGYGFEFIWPAYPGIQSIFIPFITGILSINGLRFANNFLMAKTLAPHSFLLNRIIIITGALLSLASFVIPVSLSSRLALIQLIFFSLGIFILALSVILTRYAPARFFLIAWGFFLIGVITFSLKEFGILPSNFIFDYTMQIGSGLEVVLLAMALAYRINLIRKEKDEAQAEAIANHQMAINNMFKVDKLKNEFLANTSHELRTPLNGIIGIVESMLDGALGVMSDIQKKNLAMVASSARRLFHMVSGLLDFSKLKNSDLNLQQRTIDLKQIVELVSALCKPLVGSKQLEIVNNINDGIPFVYADENRLQQIIYNLLGNAIKFTEKGTIKISAVEHNTFIEVFVTDTGIGIPPDKLEDIFKSFEQVDASTSRVYGGTGLGLSITKQLVELHGGIIRVESVFGQGSTFIFSLPKSTETEAKNTSQTYIETEILKDGMMVDLPVMHTEQSSKSKHFKVLAVDDEEINLQVLLNQLTIAGYDVVIASSGTTALEIMESGFKPDIAIVDIMMPRMTGYELCKRIRDTYDAVELPVIMLTAKNQVSDLVEGLASGANDYITKPFSKNELLARIKTHVNLSQSEKDRINMQKQIFHSSKLASIGTLAAGVAHEVNNPLTIISGCTEMIQDACNSNDFDSLPQLTEQINNSIERITNIVKGLRTYARTDSDEFDMFDIHRLIMECKGLVDYIYRKAGVEIREELNAGDTILWGNAGRFQQVLMNLLSNAKDAIESNKGGVISVTTENIDDHLVLRIKDTGCGIPEDQREKIFDTFYTTKPPGKGTGLGLGIVHSILEAMGGNISVESKVGEGTTFILKVPVRVRNLLTSGLEEKNASDEKERVEDIRMEGTVLIVDDDESIRRLLNKLLSKIGFTVEEAGDGEAGLEKIESNFYNFVITDISMPKMSGYEMIKKVREKVHVPPKIIVITGGMFDKVSDGTDSVDIVEVVDGYIFKPFSIREIRNLFAELIKTTL